MELRTERGAVRERLQKVFRDRNGLQRTQADARQPRRLRQADHVRQFALAVRLLAVSAKLDARKHHLGAALGRQRVQFAPAAFQGAGAQRAAGKGDGAVAAKVDAAVLNFQRGTGAVVVNGGQLLKAAPLKGRGRDGSGGQSLATASGGKGALAEAHKLAPSLGAHDQRHTGQSRHRFPRSFGIAAHGDHQGVGRGAVGAGEELPRLLVAHRRDRAGVDDDGVRVRAKGNELVPRRGKQLAQGFRFVLIHLAAQGGKGDLQIGAPFEVDEEENVGEAGGWYPSLRDAGEVSPPMVPSVALQSKAAFIKRVMRAGHALHTAARLAQCSRADEVCRILPPPAAQPSRVPLPP